MHATLCDMITDLTQNAMEARAQTIRLSIRETNRSIEVTIADDGKGMTPSVLQRAKSPFFTDGSKHQKRKFGLGLPFLYQTVEAVDGTVSIVSAPDQGTTVEFSLPLEAIDLPELGNCATAVTALMSGDYTGELILFRTVGTAHYQARRSELIDALGDLNHIENLSLLQDFFTSNERALRETPTR